MHAGLKPARAPQTLRTRYAQGGLGLFFRPKLLLALRQSLGAFFSAQLHLWHSDSPSGAGKLLEEEHLNSLLSVVWFQVLAHTRKVSPSVNCSVSSLEVQKLKSETRYCPRLLILIICLWRLMYMKKRVATVPKWGGMNQSWGPDLKTVTHTQLISTSPSPFINFSERWL